MIKVSLVGLLLLGCSTESSPVTIKTLPLDCGWGYQVLIHDTVFIHQPHVPVVKGYKRFGAKSDAWRTANLVKQKIEQGLPPSLTEDELKALKISSVCC